MSEIKQFWKLFVELKESIEDPPDEEAMDRLLTSLRRIDPRLYYHLGCRDDCTDIIISAEGNPDLMTILKNIEEEFIPQDYWNVVTCYDAMLLFGERDMNIYPDDTNGNVLYNMALEGDRFWIPRDIDFSFIFPDKKSAQAFMKDVRKKDLKIELSDYEDDDEFSQDVTISKEMFATHKTITAVEKEWGKIAEKYDGRNDGWGCFNQKESKS